MADYLMLIRGGDVSHAGFSPQEMQNHMQKWFTWIGKLRDQGIYKGGEPLEDEGRVVHADKTVTDGPFAESKELVGGYIMLDVESLDRAAEIAKDCPVLLVGGLVEVRPVADLPVSSSP